MPFLFDLPTLCMLTKKKFHARIKPSELIDHLKYQNKKDDDFLNFV